jgi:hypothetical protein
VLHWYGQLAAVRIGLLACRSIRGEVRVPEGVIGSFPFF